MIILERCINCKCYKEFHNKYGCKNPNWVKEVTSGNLLGGIE